MAVDGLFTNIRFLVRKIVSLNKTSQNADNLRRNCLTLSAFRSSLCGHHPLQTILQTLNRNISMIGECFGRQCSALTVQKVRRASQILTLYKKLYGEKALWRALSRFRSSISQINNKNQLYFLLSACLFSWDKEKVTDKEMSRVIDDMSKVQYSEGHHDNGNDDYLASWEEFLNKEHIKIWRRPMEGSNIYEYKVYGSYYDIPASVFYQVQADLEYRRQWDTYIVNLDVVDQDKESGCEVVHWVTKYPATWTPREYVYIRRLEVDNKQKVMAIVARGVEHPSCPNTDKYVRVSLYESIMVIKPHTEFNQKGFDYVLTYYDDPQIMFSGSATRLAKFLGINFVDDIHKAAKDLYDKDHSKWNGSTSSTKDKVKSSSSSPQIPSGEMAGTYSSYQQQYS